MNDIKEQLDKALDSQKAIATTQVLLSDLISLQEDVAEIKRLLNAPADVKYISFAARVETILNSIKRLIEHE